jgi:hypothetical protein
VLGVLEYVDEGDRVVLEALAGDIAFTLPFNLYGNPAMSMPLHWQKDFLWGAVCRSAMTLSFGALARAETRGWGICEEAQSDARALFYSILAPCLKLMISKKRPRNS